jgi:hypothetical protein
MPRQVNGRGKAVVARTDDHRIVRRIRRHSVLPSQSRVARSSMAAAKSTRADDAACMESRSLEINRLECLAEPMIAAGRPKTAHNAAVL